MRTYSGVWSALSLLALCSCGRVHYPAVDDLTLVSVDVLQQSEIADHDKFWSPGVITTPLVRVRVSSRRDFQKIAREWGYNVDNQTSLCKNKSMDPKRPLEGFPLVFDRFGMINSYNEKHPDSGSGQSGRITYSVYFDPRDVDNVNFYHYDLVKSPEDVCIVITGLQEIGGDFAIASFRSNTILVSKVEIIAAIARAGLK